jgi:hypothetical protein
MREDPRGAGPVARTARRPDLLSERRTPRIDAMTELASMPIATFAPDTTWAGTRITWDGRDFILEEHGPIAPQDVMHYDSQRWLVWEDTGTRAWVGARAAAHTQVLERSQRTSELSEKMKRILVVVIGALLVLNLVLLVVLANAVDLL